MLSTTQKLKAKRVIYAYAHREKRDSVMVIKIYMKNMHIAILSLSYYYNVSPSGQKRSLDALSIGLNA